MGQANNVLVKNMEFVETVTGFAEKYLGDIERYREIYKDNPSVIGYRLPPSAQTAIDLLGRQGLKIPSIDTLNKQIANVDTQLSKAVGNLFRDADKAVGKTGVESQVKQATLDIRSIDWLF